MTTVGVLRLCVERPKKDLVSGKDSEMEGGRKSKQGSKEGRKEGMVQVRTIIDG